MVFGNDNRVIGVYGEKPRGVAMMHVLPRDSVEYGLVRAVLTRQDELAELQERLRVARLREANAALYGKPDCARHTSLCVKSLEREFGSAYAALSRDRQKLF